MRRVIVDYKKLTPEILGLLSEKFPDGYDDDDIIIFDNHRNETIEAVEVKTDDSIYLVKVSSRLRYTMFSFENTDELELNDAGHVIINEDLKNEAINEEEE
jgi:hypothetical protein